jgi:hypothetical protein
MGWENSSVFQVVIVTGVAGSGIFVYSPTPAAGQLVASVTAAAGTDPFGNAYLQGIAAYSTGVGPLFAAQLIGGIVQISSAASEAGPWVSRGFISGDTANNLNLFAQGAGHVQAENFLAALAGASVTAGLAVTGGETADTVAISSSQAGGGLLQVTNAVTSGSAAIKETLAAAGDVFFSMLVSGDTSARIRLDTTNAGLARIRFGSGVAFDGDFERLAANLLGVVNCDFAVSTTGRGFQVKEGANAKQGTATLVGGTVVVNTTAVTASSRIFLTTQDNPFVGALGIHQVSARTAGTSFTITSTSGTDTSTDAWEIFEPAP